MHLRHRLAAAARLALLATAITRPAAGQRPASDTSWVARSALYEVFVQDFSPRGDLRGVIEGLDRIRSSGANVIWVMPVQPVGVENHKGTLGSRYAIRDYLAVDSAYGRAADFRHLVQEAHARGMKVILDWVPDHTAWDNIWVREHPDYYMRDDHGGLVVPRDPQGKPTDWTDVVQLDYGNPALRQAMIAAMRHWLVEFGLDGFRMDVAGFIPYDFWSQAIPALRSSVPRRLLFLAEWGDLAIHRTGFDLTYAWDSYSRLKAVWKGAPASTFVQGELPDMRAMPAGSMRMRFTTNHDETAWDNPPVVIFGGGEGARAAFVAMALLPGRPLLYNGQEVESPAEAGHLRAGGRGMGPAPRGPTPGRSTAGCCSCRRPIPRSLPATSGKSPPALPDDVIAYRRGDAVVLVNARPHEVRAAVTGFAVAGSRDLLTGRTEQDATVTLPAWGAVVLRGRRS